MRTIVLLCATVAFLLLGNVAVTQAQGTPDCSLCQLGVKLTSASTMLEIGQCTVVVKYSYAENGCARPYLRIDTMDFEEGCAGLDIKYLEGQIAFELLRINPMGFADPAFGDCRSVDVAAPRCTNGWIACTYCCGVYDICFSSGPVHARLVHYIPGSATENTNNCGTGGCAFGCPFY